jgi:hypothetical protein
MNIEALKQLRGHIQNLPEEKFCYAAFFGTDDDDEGDAVAATAEDIWESQGLPPPCGTAGCVAGHCISLFQLTPEMYYNDWSGESYPVSVGETAGKFLGLTQGRDSHILFYEGCGVATREDALRRIDYLIEHGSINGYPCHQEDGWLADSSNYSWEVVDVKRFDSSVPF